MENTVGQPQNIQVPNYSGVNIQIFNPSVNTPGSTAAPATINAPNYSTNPTSYPANYYTQNLAQPVKEVDKKKMEKRQIVQLTDDYVKSLENYLNDQNKQVRLMGAKEVLARLQEDDSRKNDPALNALVNKMLQDPSQPVRLMAMTALENRNATGNDTSKIILTNIQNSNQSHGEDSLTASKVLLKMAATTTEKEFEAKDKSNQPQVIIKEVKSDSTKK